MKRTPKPATVRLTLEATPAEVAALHKLILLTAEDLSSRPVLRKLTGISLYDLAAVQKLTEKLVSQV